MSSISGLFTVVIDNSAPVVVDAFTTSNNPTCEFGWSAFGLRNIDHTVVVTTGGASPKMSANTAVTPTFELDGFVITQNSTSSRAVSLPEPDMNIGLMILLTNMIFFVL
jgi:hypothetical protein